MNTDCGDRLKEWRLVQGLSQRALGSVMGVSQGYIGNIEAGRSEPSRNFLQKLTEQFGVSADWLLYGLGVPQSERASGFEARRAGKRIEPTDVGKPLRGDFRFGVEEFFLVERVDLDVSAGPGTVPILGGESEMMAFSRSWMLQNRVTPDVSVLVRVKGDSMAPTLPDGALILVDCLDRDISRPGIFAFNRGEEAFVKRLVPIGKRPDGTPVALKVISDNPAYSPDAIVDGDLEKFHPVGRVRCVVSVLD